MNSLRNLNKDNLRSINKEFQNRTYDDLSSEFQKLLPSAVRASELIALMYNRLTLVENFSHKEAVTKIHDDHKHLAGFSNRNIRRSLPLDNLNVPRRVRPQWPKNSLTGANDASKLSSSIQGQDKNPKVSLTYINTDAKKTDANLTTKLSGQSAEYSSCIELSLENRELKEALEKSSKLITADNVAYAAALSINEIHNVLEFEFYLQKQEILDYLGEPYLLLKDGDLKIWFHGKIHTKNYHVISAGIGRSQQQVDCNNTGDTQNE
jgi:hypothetical protein